MTSDKNRNIDPNLTLQRLRSRILGGGRPVLDSLSAEEMVAANAMISEGEAEIASYSCRLFLIARLRDEPSSFAGLVTATKRLMGGQ